MKGFRTIVVNAVVMITTFLAATFSGIGVDPVAASEQANSAFDAGEKIYAVGLFFLAVVNTVLRYFTDTPIMEGKPQPAEPAKSTT